MSRGIKEALGDKCGTCFLMERKHKRRGAPFLQSFKVLERKNEHKDFVTILDNTAALFNMTAGQTSDK